MLWNTMYLFERNHSQLWGSLLPRKNWIPWMHPRLICWIIEIWRYDCHAILKMLEAEGADIRAVLLALASVLANSLWLKSDTFSHYYITLLHSAILFINTLTMHGTIKVIGQQGSHIWRWLLVMLYLDICLHDKMLLFVRNDLNGFFYIYNIIIV